AAPAWSTGVGPQARRRPLVSVCGRPVPPAAVLACGVCGHGKRPRSAWLNGAVSRHDGLKNWLSQSVSPGHGFAPHLPVTSCLGCEHVGEPEPSGPGAGDGFQVAAVDPCLDRLRFHTGLGGGLVQGELHVLDHGFLRFGAIPFRDARMLASGQVCWNGEGVHASAFANFGNRSLITGRANQSRGSAVVASTGQVKWVRTSCFQEMYVSHGANAMNEGPLTIHRIGTASAASHSGWWRCR